MVTLGEIPTDIGFCVGIFIDGRGLFVQNAGIDLALRQLVRLLMILVDLLTLGGCLQEKGIK